MILGLTGHITYCITQIYFTGGVAEKSLNVILRLYLGDGIIQGWDTMFCNVIYILNMGLCPQ